MSDLSLSSSVTRAPIAVYLQLEVTGATLERALAELIDHRDYYRANADLAALCKGHVQHELVIRTLFGHYRKGEARSLQTSTARNGFDFVHAVINHMARFNPRLVDMPAKTDQIAMRQLRNRMRDRTVAAPARPTDTMTLLLSARQRGRAQMHRAAQTLPQQTKRTTLVSV